MFVGNRNSGGCGGKGHVEVPLCFDGGEDRRLGVRDICDEYAQGSQVGEGGVREHKQLSQRKKNGVVFCTLQNLACPYTHAVGCYIAHDRWDIERDRNLPTAQHAGMRIFR